MDRQEADIESETADTAAKQSGKLTSDRELRIALVCYGGVSLAVYMHGITREILKLVRASKAYHALGDHEKPKADAAAQYKADADTERVYFALLQAIGERVDLRVIVDIVAGASAGGINGVMLARALAHDLSLEEHRHLWLKLADVTELLDPLGAAGLWSKPYMRPVLWTMGQFLSRREASRLGAATADQEVREKLSLFTRSRWFEPPFSGERMCEMMLDGAESLGRTGDSKASLLPPGHSLDLFVTTTDFWGHRETITLHDPPVIREREHRHNLNFRYVRRASGDIESEFSDDHIPSLAFAARATSCFPGAFPPAQLSEIDRCLRHRDMEWSGRAEFLAHNFAPLYAAGEDPEEAAFIDGSVLMNKPFALAIQAIHGRPAHREVDRRLVYIEPNPDIRRLYKREVPGFFTTLKGALSDIPRNQPIRDDLEWLERFNARVRVLRQVMVAIKPNVMKMIAELLGERLNTPPRAHTLIAWRDAANERAARDAAYGYDGYARLKVVAVLKDISELLRALIGLEDRHVCDGHVEAWAESRNIRPLGDAAREAQAGESVPWIEFLRNFDARYRLRRLRFVIRRVNELYHDSAVAIDTAGIIALNELKAALYDHLDTVQRRMEWSGMEPLLGGEKALESSEADSLHIDTIDRLFSVAGNSLDLPALDHALDELLASWAERVPEIALWREVVIAYLGFPYYDVLTFPMAHWGEYDELDEIKVDRISANDANTLRTGSASDLLKGVELGSFGAFFSRKYRENDYLWGRLTGAERLVDIVVSAATEAVAAGAVDSREIKRQLFIAILKSERRHLTKVSELIDMLEKDCEQMKEAGPGSTAA